MENSFSQGVKAIFDNFFDGKYFSLTTILVYFIALTAVSAVVCYLIIRKDDSEDYKDSEVVWYIIGMLIVMVLISLALFIIYSIVSLLLIYCWYVPVMIIVFLIGVFMLKGSAEYHFSKMKN